MSDLFIKKHNLCSCTSYNNLDENCKFLDKIFGCLLGGAIGDALGAPVEFLTMKQINNVFGKNGISDFYPAYGGIGKVTDDTQMTLFTAEGIINSKNEKDIINQIHNSLIQWLFTQGLQNTIFNKQVGWLINQQELHSRRAPGNTCIGSLKKSYQLGKFAANESKGCGAVMRSAPIGLVVNPQNVFDIACKSAQLTHGHPYSSYSSGFFALLISNILSENSIEESVSKTIHYFKKNNISEEFLNIINLIYNKNYNTIDSFGEGWVAEEALIISLFCALKSNDFTDGVLFSVNHGGDSDSTGSMTGQILGAFIGASKLPQKWVNQVELLPIIKKISTDLHNLTLINNTE